jgi:hypothetical protein
LHEQNRQRGSNLNVTVEGVEHGGQPGRSWRNRWQPYARRDPSHARRGLMASAEFPEWTGADPAASAWNTVTLGGVQLPGICTIDGLECAINVDTKKAKGAEKPSSTDQGREASEVRDRSVDQYEHVARYPARYRSDQSASAAC